MGFCGSMAGAAETTTFPRASPPREGVAQVHEMLDDFQGVSKIITGVALCVVFLRGFIDPYRRDQGQRTENKGGSRYINRAAKGGATELRANGLREQGQSRGRIKGLQPAWIQGRSS